MGSGRYLIFLNISSLFLACVFFTIHHDSRENLFLSKYLYKESGGQDQDCKVLQTLDGFEAKCHYLKSGNPCVSEGYIDYLYLFYCNFGDVPILGYGFLFLWLLVLFYLLGNTASDYFCSSLESLSRLLNLSPTIAGVTLLSLGNGAPDVFASLVSITGSGTKDVGLNTVLGGASFVSCVVVGIISFLVRKRHVHVSKSAFIRDVCFFMLVLTFLLVILINGEISLWGALGFSSIYIVYVVIVYLSHAHWQENLSEGDGDGDEALSLENGDLIIPILHGMNKEHRADEGAILKGENIVESGYSCKCRSSVVCHWLLFVLNLPLYLPRRLTIPVVSEEKWSKPYAVISVSLAPLLLALLWNPQNKIGDFDVGLLLYGVALLIGIILGVLAFFTTEGSDPPKKGLLIWLVGGFLMSVSWSYISAQELVGLLISLGYIMGLSPSILGLTVLAWGNSLGDLITNITMAVHDGAEGTQIALSGCYAGPIFNVLFGLGLSLVGSSWCQYPEPVVFTKNPHLLETLGFLLVGLLWALVVLPRRNMKLDGVLGGGLLIVYLVSLSLRLIQTLGFL